jgi:hypothetical protein
MASQERIQQSRQPSTDDKRRALDGVSDLTKQLITLAVGTIVLSGTFLKDVLGGGEIGGTELSLLLCAWGLLLISVWTGVQTLGQYVNLMDSSECDVHDRLLVRYGQAQQASFFLGVLVFTAFAGLTLKA